jgi:UDP-N-acetylglucosamine--N-acetylmuramyl-(pentapeptide) pyrophosphoryl-undecaprenol N-acetylglucosamine transferase
MPPSLEANRPRRIAIACGGTGGHLYPGLAVAERLWEREAEVMLLVSPKDVDQRVLHNEHRFRIVVLPAIGFSATRLAGFAARFWNSYRVTRREFRAWVPDVLLSMGGFTSAPPALAARSARASIVLHEANAIPGRANRWLARFARHGYVFFPEAAARLHTPAVSVIGMPVRDQFQPADPASCRLSLGLSPKNPVLLIMGGSQGARALNALMMKTAADIAARVPGLQFLHLSGASDETRLREAYRNAGVTAVVRPFLTEMEFALGAADLAVGRAGASSIAELAAMRVPAILIPYPYAADNHQLANARALERTTAAWSLPQKEATPERFVAETVRLLTVTRTRTALMDGIAAWHRPDASAVLAEELLGMSGQQGEASRPLPASIESVRTPSTA